MKKNGNPSSYLLPLGDFILVVAVFVLGYWLRHFLLAGFLNTVFGVSNDFRLSVVNYMVSGSVMAAVQLLMFRVFRVYRQEFGIGSVEELAWILRVTLIAVIVTFVFTFAARASRPLIFSRFVLLLAFPGASIGIYIWHSLFYRFYRKWARRTGRGTRVAIYGRGEQAEELSRYLQEKVTVPHIMTGFVMHGDAEDDDGCLSFDSAREMFQWLGENDVDELLIADPGLSREITAGLVQHCEQEDLSYKIIADVSDLVTRTTRVTHLGGLTMIESVPPPLSGGSLLLKRMFDIAIAVPAIVLLLPLGLTIAAAIVIDSGLPVFYLQTRLGRDHRKFGLIKFRSMKTGSHSMKESLLPKDEYEVLSKLRKDPRVTRAGRFIRRFSLDELPQLLNVLAGSMSLVGPRPHIPEEVERYSMKHFKKLEVPPGMTGICQVSGRNDLSYSEMVKLDLYYVDNWSIWLDVSILIMTVPAIVLRRGAY